MIFDAAQFFMDHSVYYATEGHKQCQPGWINIPCPFCTGNPGYHLGYDLTAGYFNCWRCGFKPNTQVIRSLLLCSWEEAKTLHKKYQSNTPYRTTKREFKKREFRLPVGCRELSPSHIKYLRGRNFNPYKLIKQWGLLGTGPVGRYKFRIIVPIYYNGVIVSYQGRDITERNELKYKACDEAGELIHHKQILYGLDQSLGDTCILVEGVTDVWRLGPGAVCGFGINLKESQLSLLYEKFKRIFIMFDDDPQAVKEAYKVGHKLVHLGCEVTLNLIKDDPANLSQKKANKIMSDIFD